MNIKQPHGPPMTLGNMRELGIRGERKARSLIRSDRKSKTLLAA